MVAICKVSSEIKRTTKSSKIFAKDKHMKKPKIHTYYTIFLFLDIFYWTNKILDSFFYSFFSNFLKTNLKAEGTLEG